MAIGILDIVLLGNRTICGFFFFLSAKAHNQQIANIASG